MSRGKRFVHCLFVADGISILIKSVIAKSGLLVMEVMVCLSSHSSKIMSTWSQTSIFVLTPLRPINIGAQLSTIEVLDASPNEILWKVPN